MNVHAYHGAKNPLGNIKLVIVIYHGYFWSRSVNEQLVDSVVHGLGPSEVLRGVGMEIIVHHIFVDQTLFGQKQLVDIEPINSLIVSVVLNPLIGSIDALTHGIGG